MYNFFYLGKTLNRGEQMEKRISLKREVKITMVLVLAFVLLSAIYLALVKFKGNSEPELLNYVPSKVVTNEDIPVVKEETKLLNPYTDSNVKIGKYYYDYKADKTKQENSITENDNTYMQNSGIDFIASNTFDVISSQNGEVTNVKEDDLLGKTIEIKHDNNYMSVYQSLSEVNVKKGDQVTAGQIIGKSGHNKLDEELGNHLHYELYIDGKIVNPEDHLNKEIKSSKNQQ